MYKFLPNRINWYETYFLGFSCFLCFGLVLFRVFFTGSSMFLFLVWNLFLAAIPWMLTRLVSLRPRFKKPFILVLIMSTWLLFFPNAPYILTDLFHLRISQKMPIWYDLLMILSFAWTGLLFGFFSLWDIEKILKERFHNSMVKCCAMLLLFIASFGIYIGRYLRWNSWDIVTSPQPLVYDIGHRIIHPLEHPQTWGMTLFMFLFLSMMYWSMQLIKSKRS